MNTTKPTQTRTLSWRRTVLIGVAVMLLLIAAAVVFAAGPIMSARAGAALACRLGVPESDVAVRIGDPVPAVGLVTGTIRQASVELKREGATTTLKVDNINLHAKTVSRVSATTTVPWDAVQKKVTALPDGVSLSGADGEVEVSMASRPGIKILLKVSHTKTSITVKANNMVLGGFTTPLPENIPTANTQLHALTQAHTITPDLPRGSTITGATATTAGLQIRTTINPATMDTLGDAGASSLQGQKCS